MSDTPSPPELAHAVSIAEERMRARIAIGLHDEVGQLLSLARIRLALIANRLSPREASEIRGVDTCLEEATRQLRSLTFELASPVLRQLGLVAAIEALVPQVMADGGPQVHVASDRRPDLDAETEGIMFRVVRELLVNARKHATATHVWIIVSDLEEGTLIKVRDDGCGLREETVAGAGMQSRGFGLASSRAQVESLGGAFRIRHPSGGGTEFVLLIPRRADRVSRTGAAHDLPVPPATASGQ